MKIKRYVDSDMRHVLRRVREDQGPDAVILSNRRVDDGIEVIAAIDYDEALMQSALGQSATETVPGGFKQQAEPAARAADVISDDRPAADASEPSYHDQRDIIATPVRPTPADVHVEPPAEALAEPSPAEQTLAGMREELSTLRAVVEAQLSGLLWNDSERRSPVRAQMLRNLARIGIAPDIAQIIINRLEPTEAVDQVWRSPLSELAELLPVAPDRLIQDGGTAALIGPTGVGKTTTIAKIAAQFSMQHGSDEIALICADAYRIGAKEHLTAFGNIIGVKVHAASTPGELNELLTRLRSRKLILIDTEGLSQRDIDLADRLAAFGTSEDQVKFYLTLSAACQEAAIDETIRGFNRVPLAGAIITKIDEAAQLGCVLSATIRHDLPAAWFSNGQRIPDDLHAAADRRLWLINQAVECLQASDPQVDERLLAERYGQVNVNHA